MNGFSARLVVKQGISFYVGHTLFIFHAGEFDWHYDDEIELTLEVQSPVSQESYLRLVKPKLTVSELPYLG